MLRYEFEFIDGIRKVVGSYLQLNGNFTPLAPGRSADFEITLWGVPKEGSADIFHFLLEERLFFPFWLWLFLLQKLDEGAALVFSKQGLFNGGPDIT